MMIMRGSRTRGIGMIIMRASQRKPAHPSVQTFAGGRSGSFAAQKVGGGRSAGTSCSRAGSGRWTSGGMQTSTFTSWSPRTERAHAAGWRLEVDISLRRDLRFTPLLAGIAPPCEGIFDSPLGHWDSGVACLMPKLLQKRSCRRWQRKSSFCITRVVKD